ncbi:efflux RND transporter periplasmic adaptor subunit [Urbifossiella limnaea]|uniref:HlyD family secretion protein n=1 Tax=Urbifossiella limnaea TaxID=2528023 RepID=A0A517XML3_9BACT|nr:efflux RND transporter periplasmic adaptor subunit [Urbifossiella limnaea]QDU18744.1 HlyD family secretion protein [Urbifossiella limnaea]
MSALSFRGVARALVAAVVLGGAAAAAVHTRERWQPLLFPVAAAPADDHAAAPAAATGRVVLSEQAQKNLGLTTAPLTPTTFWKTATLPGMVVDRPGVTDRGVIAPATGVVAKVHKAAGEAVRPGEVLFTLKLLSESIHLTQTELFKAAQDAELAKAQRATLASSGVAPPARLTEIDNQLTRLAAAARAYRADLLNRGLTPEQIDAAAAGTFATEMRVTAPSRAHDATGVELEVQEIRGELGRLVQSGETLCLLSDHRLLAVEGRAFPDEAPLIDRAARGGWPVEVDFGDEGWPSHGQTFRVEYVAATIDPESRTFRFRFPLDNQARGDGKDEWRFRPGQRVRVLVRVEKLDDVFALPADAVVREGAEAYVFRRNGDSFDRKPVHVVYQDRRHAVLANDGSVSPGAQVAQSGAAQLNRMAKAGTGAAPPGYHVHADGSVHANH